MKKVIGYIISLTAILLLVIFLTVPTVDVAIAANDSTSLSLKESRVPEVDMYSADKIKQIKPFKELKPEVVESPSVMSSNKCPDKDLTKLKLNCSQFQPTNISRAFGHYKQAVSDCKEGNGTIEAANEAWRKLENLCQNNKGVIEEL